MLLHIQKSLAGFSFFGKGVRTYVRTLARLALSYTYAQESDLERTCLIIRIFVFFYRRERGGICMMMVLHVIGWRFPRRPHMIDDSDMRVHVVINQYSTRTPYHVTITLHRAYLASQLHE
jgi:hypothetical protein